MNELKARKLDVFSSIHEPYWIASVSNTEYPTLNENITVDVAIVGGGITGITTAFLLKNRGLKVAVIEAGRIAHGTTGHTTAKLTSQHGLIYSKITSKFGKEKARQYAEANEAAIHFIADLVKEKSIDCDFCWTPSYVYTQSEDYIEKIQNEVDTAGRLGIKASYEEKLGLPFDIKAAIKFENQAQFHPLKYLTSIAKAIPGDGSHIFEFSKAVDVEDKEKCIVVTNNGSKVTASKVIISSHFPCYDGLGMYFARMYAEKSYVLGVKIKDKFPGGTYITAEEPGRSLRSQRYEDGEMILVGGEHHKTGSEEHTSIHYENLGKYANETFDVQEVLYRWSTQDCMTVDDVPYVGYLTSKTSNVLVATGYGKWGMTNSTAAANILTDLITKGDSPWAPVYNPSRFDILASGAKLVKENLDVAQTLFVGKVTPAPKDADIKNGEAKIVNIDGDKYGAFRDEKGELHIVDVTCTHLGCELIWNDAEKTWDCPCHGSRFTYDGDNVESPAFNHLRHPGEGPNKKDPNIF